MSSFPGAPGGPPPDLLRVLAELMPALTRGDLRLWRWSRVITIIAGMAATTAFVQQQFDYKPQIRIEDVKKLIIEKAWRPPG
jgi:hypothetical protein